MTQAIIKQPTQTTENLTLSDHADILNRKGFTYLTKITEQNWLDIATSITQCTPIKQDNNEYIYPVKPATLSANRGHSQSQNPVYPHTDGGYCQNTPKYLALYGIKSANCGGGFTQLMDIRPFITYQLTEDEQFHLTQTKYHFSNNHNTQSLYHPVLEFPTLSDIRFRFSYNNLVFGEPSPNMNKKPNPQDNFIHKIANRLLIEFEKNHVSIRIEENGLLIFNNWQCIHARSSFKDSSRHLLRVWLS